MRPYAPRTDRGMGILLPLSKSVGHIMAIHTAIRTERPLTAEQALSELTEAQAHMQDLQLPERLLSNESMKEIGEFNDLIRDTIATMRTTIAAHLDAPMTNEDLPNLQAIAERSWTICSIMDQELAGLPEEQADPGRLP